MDNEMININANLVDDVRVSTFTRENQEIEVANFTLVKKYGDGKEYINCSVYGEKVDIARKFKKGDVIHVYGYYKENRKEDKVYKNFIVKSLNKVERENKEEN